jgi:hypothetical protein
MTSLSPELHRDIRQTLLDCGSFNDSSYLRDLFTDGRISPWRYSLPSRDNVIALVEAYIAFLVGKTRADTGKNALVLFLQVLSDKLDPVDACHSKLADVATQLANHLTGDSFQPVSKPQARTTTDPFVRYESGLKMVASALENDPDAVQELTVFEQRLQENIDRSRRYGDTSERRAERSEIIDNLNIFSRATTNKTFNQWCDS